MGLWVIMGGGSGGRFGWKGSRIGKYISSEGRKLYSQMQDRVHSSERRYET